MSSSYVAAIVKPSPSSDIVNVASLTVAVPTASIVAAKSVVTLAPSTSKSISASSEIPASAVNANAFSAFSTYAIAVADSYSAVVP